jgi:hypothetical protein
VQAAAWTDKSGNYWLFGGYGYDSTGAGAAFLGDLWVYEADTKLWRWVQGSSNANDAGTYGVQGAPSTQNVPGARSAASYWTDSSGRFWLFGGFGFDSTNAEGYLSDLWMFDPTTLQWTWVAGSNLVGAAAVYSGAPASLTPGARYSASAWADGVGRLWLFGGNINGPAASPNEDRNDLWMFEPTTGVWKWQGGSVTIAAAGNYGALGVELPSNQPGAREAASTWVDASGALWMYGGTTTSANGTYVGFYNDLWRFDTSRLEWTWVAGGQSSALTAPTFGQLGVAAATSSPGSRVNPVVWNDAAGNLWLFGGGESPSLTTGFGNDLWRFSPNELKWSFMGGATTLDAAASHGSLGIAAPSNTPGGVGFATAAQFQGHVLMFGGESNLGPNYSDALWER